MTANGIEKGKPGTSKARKVLSLGERKRCYHGHAMTEANTFNYTKPATKKQPNPTERIWCRKCRATSRTSSKARLTAERATSPKTTKTPTPISRAKQSAKISANASKLDKGRKARQQARKVKTSSSKARAA